MSRRIVRWLRLLGRRETLTQGPVEEPAGDVGDLATGYWEVHKEEAAAASMTAMARRLPALMRAAMSLGWRASRRDTVAVVVCNLTAGAMTSSGLLATNQVLTQLLSAVPTADRLRAALPALVLVAGLGAARSVLLAGAGWAQERLRPMVDRLAEQDLWEVTIRMDAAAFEDSDVHDQMLRARDQGTYRARMVVTGVADLVSGLVSVAAGIATLTVLHPLLAPLALLVTLPDGWAAVRAAKMQYAANRSINRVRRRMVTLGDRMADRNYAIDLRAFTFGGWLLREWGLVADIGQREQVAVAAREARTRMVGKALSGLASLLVYGVLGLLLIVGGLALAVAGTAVLAIRTSRGALDSVITALNRLYEDGLYYGDLLEFIATARTRFPAGSDPAPAGFDQITCERVSFTYPGASTPALDDVSLTIRRGEVVAFVGVNGSGKSTLSKLLAGIYPPSSGVIRWDDTDITTIAPDQLWAQIAMVSQEHARWPLTAGSNIMTGLARDPERLAAAARAGRAEELIADLPHGYGTTLDKRFAGGADLSGGQWQRVAAARGFYRAAGGGGGRLMICDEPTSEVDAIAEHEMLESVLAHRSPDRAIVLITHRLSSVMAADRIYVLDHGRLVEVGTHTELLAAEGRYARMFRLQASRYHDTAETGDLEARHVLES